MDTSAFHSRDALVARAIDSVLDAERASQERVALCERQCQDLLEQARQKRRTLMERARARIVLLHTRVARGIEAQDAKLKEHSARAEDKTSVRLRDPVRWDAALAKLAQSLTSPEETR